MTTKKIFNAATQQLEDAELTVDANNEIVATFSDEGFVKFPAGLTSKEFDHLIAETQSANEGQEVITPEYLEAKMRDRAASLKLIGADTTAEGQSNVNQSPS